MELWVHVAIGLRYTTCKGIKKTGQRKRLIFSVVTTNGSADSHGMLWHRDGILKVSHIEARELGLCSIASTGCWMQADFKGVTLGKAALLGHVQFPRKDSAVRCKQAICLAARGWMPWFWIVYNCITWIHLLLTSSHHQEKVFLRFCLVTSGSAQRSY